MSVKNLIGNGDARQIVIFSGKDGSSGFAVVATEKRQRFSVATTLIP